MRTVDADSSGRSGIRGFGHAYLRAVRGVLRCMWLLGSGLRWWCCFRGACRLAAEAFDKSPFGRMGTALACGGLLRFRAVALSRASAFFLFTPERRMGSFRRRPECIRRLGIAGSHEERGQGLHCGAIYGALSSDCGALSANPSLRVDHGAPGGWRHLRLDCRLASLP